MAKVLISIRSSVQGLNVERIEGDSGGGVLNDLLPGAKRIVASGPI